MKQDMIGKYIEVSTLTWELDVQIYLDLYLIYIHNWFVTLHSPDYCLHHFLSVKK